MGVYVKRYWFSIFVVVDRCLLYSKTSRQIGAVEALLPSVNKYKNHQPIPYNIHTVWWFESRKLFEYYKKKSCVSNRTDTSALSEWMVVRPFRSLVQLRGSPNASGLQAHDLFL